ncbi:MAG TPA: hypothetical protein VFS23_24050, partial [Vicinamibacterales bacterium]|nr:hypothetical protein [Vicinamibacterales bacterium]
MTKSSSATSTLADRALQDRVVSRIWERDASLWGATPGSPDALAITHRLGWLDVHRTMPPEVERIERVVDDAKRERIAAVVFIASRMSSLGAQVIVRTLARAEERPDFQIVPSGDGAVDRAALGGIDPGRTWVVVASKTGHGPEVLELEGRLRHQLGNDLGPKTTRQFIALTDPGTDLQQLATASGYREVFLNPPDIGERFSVLSLFGLLPAGLIGVSPRDLLTAGSTMSKGCLQENHANAGLELGAFIAGAVQGGCGSLQPLLAPSLSSLAPWIGQLMRPLFGPTRTGRPAVVAIASDRDEPEAGALEAAERESHPVTQLS